ncbi:MAG: hypothetical protein MZW92_08110 [Comamonadaceae bacterium]|nr:hypothetical protein [Comamonadaceae bacterium]
MRRCAFFPLTSTATPTAPSRSPDWNRKNGKRAIAGEISREFYYQRARLPRLWGRTKPTAFFKPVFIELQKAWTIYSKQQVTEAEYNAKEAELVRPAVFGPAGWRGWRSDGSALRTDHRRKAHPPGTGTPVFQPAPISATSRNAPTERRSNPRRTPAAVINSPPTRI